MEGQLTKEEYTVSANNYESVLITEPEISTDQVDQMLAKIKQLITDNKGTFTAEDRWGRRRLAYPIQGHREGFYTVFTFNAEPTIVSALEHFYNVTDSIVRHLVVKVIKKNKTFAPRRVRPAGAVESSSRPGGYRGSSSSRPRTDAPRPAASAPTTTETPAAPTSPAAPADVPGGQAS